MSQVNIPTTKLNSLTDILATNTAPSFVGGGIVTTDMGNYWGTSVAVQADGKILLGGSSDIGFALLRYNSDGVRRT